jgi:PKD repeat protein
LVLEKNATALGFATFFGDTSSTGSEHVDGGTSRFDKKGVIYQAVCAGCGGSSLFPTTPGVVSNVNGSTSCNNAVFKYDFSLLKAKYQPSVFQGCAPISIRFNSESIFAQNYIWDFQDGPRVNTTQDTISHLFDSAGTYKVKLIALNADACPNIDSLERTIRIEKAPVFSGDTLLFCSFQDTLQLPTLPSGSLTYNWSPSIFLSGTTFSAPKVIRPDSTINYTGSVRTGFGCISTAQFRVSDGVLKASSEADTLQGCRPLTINFSNKSYKAKKSTWFWGTGDSTESNLPVQSFTFNQAGVFKVILKVENDTSCIKSDFDTLTIRVFDLPVLNDTTLLFCQTGSFQLKPGPNSGKKFSWTPSIGLNDSTLSQPTVSNISPRIFSLAIKDSNQCAAKATIKIKDGILFAKAKADTLKGCKPLIVSFENNSYRSVESTWFWGNGDSTVTNLGSLNYEFQQAGDFKVVLIAKNDTSCNKIAFDTLVVQVLDLPVFSDTILKYCQNGNFNLKAAKNNGKSFLWTPADGLNDPTLANPTLTNPEPRIFNLAIIDSNQCRSSANVVLKDGRLKSDFTAGVFLACAPVSLILNNLSTNPQRSIWLWDGDSAKVEGNEIVPIVLNRPGNYEIKLKVRSDSACQKEDVSSRFLVIGGIPEFPKNTTSFCPGDSITLSVSSSPGYQYQWPVFAKPFSSDSSKAKLLVIDSLRFEVNVLDSLNCPGKQEFELIPSKPKANFDAVSKFEICIDRLNYDFKANPLNGASYQWKIADSDFNGPVVSYTFSKRGTYPVQMIVNQQSCKDTLLKNLEVKDSALVLEPNFEFIPRLLGCDQLPRLEVKNLSIGAEKSVWSWNGNSVFQPEPQVVIREPQTLEMNLLVYNGLCSRSLTKSISIEPLLTPNLLTVNGDGFNQNLKINNLPAGSRMSIKNRWGQEIFSSNNYQNDWSPPSDFTTGFYLLVLPNGEFCNNWLQVVR